MTNAKIMVKNNIVYMCSSLAAQSISVLIVPVYTKNMSLDDFGLYNLLITVQMLLSIMATLGISSGLTRFFNEFEDRNLTKNTALTCVIMVGCLVAIPIVTFSDSIYSILFGSDANGGQMLIIVMASTLCLSVTSIYNAYYNMHEKAIINGIASVSKSLLLLIGSIVMIIYWNMGLMGALWAQLFAYGTVALVLMATDYRHLRIELAPRVLKPMLKYGLGLIPGDISGWVYSLIDRYFIKAMLGLASVGIYSMGFKLGALFEPLFLQPFRWVFTAFIYRVYKENAAREKIYKVFTIYASISWFIAFGLSVFARPGILLLSTEEYMEAAMVVPLVATAYVLRGFDEFYALGLYLSNNTAAASAIVAITAAMNVVLNLVLIPLAGFYGAAMATVLCALAMNLINYRAGKRYYEVGVEYWEGLKPLPATAAAYAAYAYASSGIMGLAENIIISCFTCCGFLAAAYCLNVIPRELYHMFFQMVGNRLKWVAERY